MRLSGRNTSADVGTVPDADLRPIRLQLGGNTYRMEPDEAIGLATKLADAVDELNEGKQP